MKIYVTRQIPEAGINMLRNKGYEVEINSEDRVLTKEEIIKKAKGCDALLCLLTDMIDAEVMDALLPRVKIIANYAVGFNNIDVKVAAERKLPISNTPGPEITESVAEHTFMLMLAVARRLVESDRFTRDGKYKGWGPLLLLGADVYSKTLGVIGLGAIGKALAQRAVNGFRMKVLYNDMKRDEAFEREFGAKYVSKEELLKNSDFVSLHVPLLPSTKHLIGANELNIMKPTAFLVNTSRGPVVDEKALLIALRDKKIAGAALDVYECEPAIDCDLTDNLELRAMDNVILTPHTASATVETRSAMSVVAAQNIIAVLEGGEAPNAVKA
jgi:glyoxylate reductase